VFLPDFLFDPHILFPSVFSPSPSRRLISLFSSLFGHGRSAYFLYSRRSSFESPLPQDAGGQFDSLRLLVFSYLLLRHPTISYLSKNRGRTPLFLIGLLSLFLPFLSRSNLLVRPVFLNAASPGDISGRRPLLFYYSAMVRNEFSGHIINNTSFGQDFDLLRPLFPQSVPQRDHRPHDVSIIDNHFCFHPVYSL